MVDDMCIEESELPTNLDDDSLDVEVSALFHNNLQMNEVSGLFITKVNQSSIFEHERQWYSPRQLRQQLNIQLCASTDSLGASYQDTSHLVSS